MTDIHTQTAELLNQLHSATSHAKTLANPKPKPTYYDAAKALVVEAEPIAKELNELQETLSLLDDGNDISTQTENLPSEVDCSPVDFELWETLAYDIALDYADKQTIAKAYNLSLAQLEQLQENSYFCKMLQAKKDEVKQIGSDAEFVVKMRMIANRATPQFLKRLTDSSTNTKDFHALFKTAVELAKLVPQQDEKTNTPQAVIGASVTFNIQGVPGLEHLVKPMAAETNIIDADYSEVTDSNSIDTVEPEPYYIDDELLEL